MVTIGANGAVEGGLKALLKSKVSFQSLQVSVRDIEIN